MNKKLMIGTVASLAFLVGCGCQQNDKVDTTEEDTEGTEQVIEGTITYDCEGEKVRVEFNNELEPKSANLTFLSNDATLLLTGAVDETESGIMYSDGEITFLVQKDEAKLSIEGREQALNCTKQEEIMGNEITDINGNVITEGCQTWFDGCNTCKTIEPGAPMACTRKACSPDAMEEAHCLDGEL
ncbi:MAG: hypothetical protein ABFQ53_00885 [Patescibacteria group bacterium]